MATSVYDLTPVNFLAMGRGLIGYQPPCFVQTAPDGSASVVSSAAVLLKALATNQGIATTSEPYVNIDKYTQASADTTSTSAAGPDLTIGLTVHHASVTTASAPLLIRDVLDAALTTSGASTSVVCNIDTAAVSSVQTNTVSTSTTVRALVALPTPFLGAASVDVPMVRRTAAHAQSTVVSTHASAPVLVMNWVQSHNVTSWQSTTGNIDTACVPVTDGTGTTVTDTHLWVNGAVHMNMVHPYADVATTIAVQPTTSPAGSIVVQALDSNMPTIGQFI